MDWQTLLAQYGPTGGVLLLIGAGVYQFWPAISKAMPPAPVVPAVPTADADDAADVAAMRRLQARFKRLNCPEGTAALDVVGTHFFHTGP